MIDPAKVLQDIRKLKADVTNLRERLTKMNNDVLAAAAKFRRSTGNRRGRRRVDQPNPGRRSSDPG